MYSQVCTGGLLQISKHISFVFSVLSKFNFLIVGEIYKMIRERVQNEYKQYENKTQMNLDMTQFGGTQNQKQTQARTLLWGKYIKLQPCLASERVRSSEHKATGRFNTKKMTVTYRGFPD